MGQLLFKKCFWDAIRSGSKRTTIRRWTSPRVRAGGRAYAPGLGWLKIASVEVVELAALDEADAKADGFESHAEMTRSLFAMYPEQAGDGKRWFKVEFEIETETSNPAADARNKSESLK